MSGAAASVRASKCGTFCIEPSGSYSVQWAEHFAIDMNAKSLFL